MLGLLVLEVTCNLLFIYYASWLGQSVVRDIRIKLFNHILGFKMKYFDNSSVGVLITRTVTDMERIADIFGEGLFMIFSDILKMSCGRSSDVLYELATEFIVFFTLPIVLIATKVFQKYMKKAFEDVATEVSNLNSFVQERITGMKIVQIFAREEIESKILESLTNVIKKDGLKLFGIILYFFQLQIFYRP